MKRIFLTLTFICLSIVAAKAQPSTYSNVLINTSEMVSEYEIIDSVMNWHIRVDKPEELGPESLVNFVCQYQTEEEPFYANHPDTFEIIYDSSNYTAGVTDYYGTIDLHGYSYSNLSFYSGFYWNLTPPPYGGKYVGFNLDSTGDPTDIFALY